jgi:hypothetical protein
MLSSFLFRLNSFILLLLLLFIKLIILLFLFILSFNSEELTFERETSFIVSITVSKWLFPLLLIPRIELNFLSFSFKLFDFLTISSALLILMYLYFRFWLLFELLYSPKLYLNDFDKILSFSSGLDWSSLKLLLFKLFILSGKSSLLNSILFISELFSLSNSLGVSFWFEYIVLKIWGILISVIFLIEIFWKI